MTKLRFSRRSFPWFAFVLLLSSFLVGCGSSAPHVAVLEGTVKVDGAPANSGQVLVTADNGSVTGSMIQADGTYKVVGLPLGAVKIAVLSQEKPEPIPGTENTPTPAGMKENPAVKKVENPIPIPPKYSDKSTSGLVTTLKNGTNTFPIDLSSK
jgi:hypothetical protein